MERALGLKQMELFKLKLRQRGERESGRASPKRLQKYQDQEILLVRDTIRDYGLNRFTPDFEVLSVKSEDPSEDADNSAIFEKYSRVFDVLKDFYFEYSQQLIDSADKEIADQLAD